MSHKKCLQKVVAENTQDSMGSHGICRTKYDLPHVPPAGASCLAAVGRQTASNIKIAIEIRTIKMYAKIANSGHSYVHYG